MTDTQFKQFEPFDPLDTLTCKECDRLRQQNAELREALEQCEARLQAYRMTGGIVAVDQAIYYARVALAKSQP